MRKTLFIIIVSTFFAHTALAGLEVSIGWSRISLPFNSGNWSILYKSMSGTDSVIGDIKYYTNSNIGIGYRYSNYALEASNASNDKVSLNNKAHSALLGYRIYNNNFILGFVGTYSLSNEGYLKNTTASTGSAEAKAGDVTQYTGALEIGFRKPFLFTVEVGNGFLRMVNFSNGQTLLGSPTTYFQNAFLATANIGYSF